MNIDRDLRQNAVLVFADLQEDIKDRDLTNDPRTIVRSVGALVRLAKICSIPVIATTIPIGSGNLIPELSEFGPPVVRTGANAFSFSAFRNAVEAVNRQELLICGVSSEIVVQSTALGALRRGYRVQLIVDACGGRSQRTEHAAFDRVQQAGGVLASVASVAAELMGDFSEPVGKEVVAVLMELTPH